VSDPRRLTDAQAALFYAPVTASARLTPATYCTCEPWPCNGPGGAQWASCSATCKACRSPSPPRPIETADPSSGDDA
jgi:hypothetical protein